MFIPKKLLQGTSIAGAGCLIVLLLILAVLTFNTALVALVWNVIGLHSLFGLGTLSFVQCIGFGFVLMLFGG